MNKRFRFKQLAFTLAEMMVILGIFSAIAAATLPVISARQNLDNSDTASNPVAVDPWIENNEYNAISYYDRGTSLINTSAVMIGGQVTDNASSIGYPQLIVKSNKEFDNDGGSQITLFKKNGNSSYYGGRILLGNNKDVINSVALGANAMDAEIGSQYYREDNIAIGTYAMNAQLTSGDSAKNSIAIGFRALNPIDSARNLEDTIGIGIESGYGGNYKESVLIGNYTGSVNNDASSDFKQNVMIGSHAGANVSSAENHVHIGYYAGFGQSGGSGNVNLGVYSGYSETDSSDNSVSVGTYSTYNPTSKAIDVVALGARSAYKAALNDKNIYIGYSAGENSYTSATGDRHAIMLGAFAGARENAAAESKTSFGATTPIVIGPYAAYKTRSMTSTGGISNENPVIIGYHALSGTSDDYTGSEWSNLPDVTIGAYSAYGSSGDFGGSVLVGYYAGANSTSLRNTVCLGFGTCANSRGSYDVRIAPYGMNKNSLNNTNKAVQYLRAGLSHIGYIGAIPSSDLDDYVDESTESTMIITPFMSADDNSNFNTSSIVLYAQRVYGPRSTFNVVSDRRLKENIKSSKYGLNEIRKINVYEYTWKADETNQPHIGVIAQEMQKVFPQGVHKGEDGYLSIDSSWLIYPMVNAIKELDKSVISLQHNLKIKLKEYTELSKRIVELEKQVQKLEKENKSLTKEIKVAYKKAKNAERR